MTNQEHVSYLVTNIRNDVGVRRRVIILRSKTNKDYAPQLYSETVWFSFSTLLHHVENRILTKISNILTAISTLEQNILDNSTGLLEKGRDNVSPEILESVLGYYSKLTKLENEFALVKDDLLGLEKNMKFLGKTEKAKYNDYKLAEQVISGNAKRLANPQNTIAFGMVDRLKSTVLSECSLSHYCILCNGRSKAKDGSELSFIPPHKMGSMEETLSLIDFGVVNSRFTEQKINRCMKRTKSFVNNLYSILSAKVNLNLDLSISQNSIEQKNILSKIEAVLETSEKERKLTERIAGTIELVSLLFASFVVGEISTSFIIWGFQNIWSSDVPWWIYFAGFSIALVIAGLFFIPIYLFLNHKKTT